QQLSALRARRIGFVFQRFFLLEGMSALENVASGLLYAGVPAPRRRELAAATLTRVGLGARLAHHPAALSGGQRQRAATARPLARPASGLADEPPGNLDAAAGAGILRLLNELHTDGTTIVVITHNLEVAAQMRRQIELLDGCIRHDFGRPA